MRRAFYERKPRLATTDWSSARPEARVSRPGSGRIRVPGARGEGVPMRHKWTLIPMFTRSVRGAARGPETPQRLSAPPEMKPVGGVQTNETLHLHGHLLRGSVERLLRCIARELPRLANADLVREVPAAIGKHGHDGSTGGAREPERTARHARGSIEESHRNGPHRHGRAVDLHAEHATAAKMGEERQHGERLGAHVGDADTRAPPGAILDFARLVVGLALHRDQHVDTQRFFEERPRRLPRPGVGGHHDDAPRERHRLFQMVRTFDDALGFARVGRAEGERFRQTAGEMREGPENVDQLPVVRARAEHRPEVLPNARPNAGQSQCKGNGKSGRSVANQRQGCVCGAEAGERSPERAVGPEGVERPPPLLSQRNLRRRKCCPSAAAS